METIESILRSKVSGKNMSPEYKHSKGKENKSTTYVQDLLDNLTPTCYTSKVVVARTSHRELTKRNLKNS